MEENSLDTASKDQFSTASVEENLSTEAFSSGNLRRGEPVIASTGEFTPEDKRQDKKLTYAGWLAVSLWASLGIVILFHLIEIHRLTGLLANKDLMVLPSPTSSPALSPTISPTPSPIALPGSSPTAGSAASSNLSNAASSLNNVANNLNNLNERTDRIEKAIAVVNDTTKSLYTFLTPLIAGVTAFFFNASKS
jgi:hypothetical protein